MNDIVLKYVGGGAYVSGLPAKDLTATDIAASGFALEQIQAFSSGGAPLYVPAESAQPAINNSQEDNEVSNG